MHEIILNQENDAKLVHNVENNAITSVQPAWTTVNTPFEQVKQLIVGVEAASRRDAWPEAYFSHQNTANMLQYHNQYNVLTKDDLCGWQRFIIEQAIGKIERSRNKKAIDIGRAEKLKLNDLQNRNDTALISLD
ncbi:hypothetical protein MMC29_000316, partial [Sticta canariensis]|nr:hypothetical protein [Sticta canariensis]